MQPILFVFVLFSILQASASLNCSYKGDPDDKPPITIKFFTHDKSSELVNTICSLFSHIAELDLIVGNKNAISQRTYCKDLEDVSFFTSLLLIPFLGYERNTSRISCHLCSRNKGANWTVQLSRSHSKSGPSAGLSLILTVLFLCLGYKRNKNGDLRSPVCFWLFEHICMLLLVKRFIFLNFGWTRVSVSFSRIYFN
jgi:hypothetical protein